MLMTDRCFVTRAILSSCLGIVLTGGAQPARVYGESVPSANAPGAGPAVLWPELPYDGPLPGELDSYGGWTKLQGKKTGFFHVEKIGPRWWFVTPEGNAYFKISMTGGLGRDGARAKDDARRLRAWGFNTISAGGHAISAEVALAYTASHHFGKLAKTELPIPSRAGFPPWVSFPDVFDPQWAAACETYAAERLKALADDRRILGHYLDNEPCLSGWYEAATRTAADSPARKAFVEVVRRYYADKPDRLVSDWKKYSVTKVEDILAVQGDPPPIAELKTAWNVAVADKYFSTMTGVCRKYDPNHAILGIRLFSGDQGVPEILGVMGKYCDVLSLNLYSIVPDRLLTQMFTILPTIHELTGRPIITSEFSYRGADTLCPNTVGAPPTVPTQTDRAVGYLSYVSAAASMPFYVGVCWYMFSDDRVDVDWTGWKEDCNFGVVDGHRRPYAVLTETMRRVNAAIYEFSADPVRNKECPLFWRTELMRWDVDWDQKMLRCFGQMEPPADPLAAMLPAKRRFHENHWVRFRSPGLSVNDDRLFGMCQANMVGFREDGTNLILLGTRGLMTVPRAWWFGSDCGNPEASFPIESNAQVLERTVDRQGRVQRLTLVDGSFVRTSYDQTVVRMNVKVPYLDLRYDWGGKRLTVTTRGETKRLGVRDINGWTVAWNGKEAAAATAETRRSPEGVTTLVQPE